MSSLSARLRASFRLRLAVVGAVGLLLVSAGGLIAANASSQGPFTGCLSTKLGLLYNVAQGAPMAACFKGDTVVTFSNAQGPAGPTGPAGPKQTLQVQLVNNFNADVPPHSYAGNVAVCPPGSLLTGGGYWGSWGTDPGVFIMGDAPAQPPNQAWWVVGVFNSTDTDYFVNVHALCASLGT